MLPATVRIDVVEDQQFTRELAVERLQARAGDAARVRGFAGVEALLAAGDPGDVIILDLHLDSGGVEGPAAVELLVSMGMSVLVLSGSHSAEVMERAHAAGARGYVGKDTADVDDLVTAVVDVLAGHHYVDAKLLARVGAAARKKLSLRQQEVLRLEALGLNLAQIARRLDPPIAEAGVKRHIEHIKDVYPECAKQTDRTRLAFRLGLVTPWEVPPDPSRRP